MERLTRWMVIEFASKSPRIKIDPLLLQRYKRVWLLYGWSLPTHELSLDAWPCSTVINIIISGLTHAHVHDIAISCSFTLALVLVFHLPFYNSICGGSLAALSSHLWRWHHRKLRWCAIEPIVAVSLCSSGEWAGSKHCHEMSVLGWSCTWELCAMRWWYHYRLA